MIETDKMLQLRRYVTLLRAGAKSRVVRSHPSTSASTSTSRQVSSYVSQYLHRGTCPSRLQMHLRSPAKSYTATCIIRTLGTTVPQSSVDDVEHKLVSLCDDVKKGRVSAYGLKEVIRLCNEIDYQLPRDTGVLLLSCCGSLLADLETSERQQLAEQVWQLAKRNSEGLTLEYYNTLLNVHMENLTSVDPKKFLADMRELEPDKNTYRLLLNAVAKMGNSNQLQDVISLMKEKNVIDEDMFNTLVQIYATNDNIAQAEHVITLMRDANLSTDKAYTELACGYAKLGDIPNLVKILNDEPQSDTNILKLIKVLSISNNGRHIPVVLNFLMTSVPVLKSQISKTIMELTRLSRATDAHTIINCLAMNDTTKDIAKGFVNSFLNDLVMLNASVDDIMRYATDFVDSGCEPLALTNVAETSLKLGRENLSLAVFKMMRERGLELRPHYYWPLLVMAHHSKGEAKIFSLIKLMMDTGVTPDSDTLINYVYPYVNTASPITVLQKLLIIGISSSITYTPLISFLLSHKRMQEVKSFSTCNKQFKINYKELIKPLVRAYIATKDVDTCVSLLMVFSHGQSFVALFLKLLLLDRHLTLAEKNLQLFLTEFEKHGARISERDATVLKNILTNEKFNATEDNRSMLKLIDNLVDPNKKESLLSLITHPKLMSTDELTCLLVEQKSKNLDTRNTLRQLLEAYCTENNLRKTEEIKREFDACQYKWSATMKVHLFELYVRNNKLKEAETLLSDLQTMFDNFKIDNVKLVMFATALVKANKPQQAFEVITNSNVNLKTDAQKTCYTLLLAFAQSKYHSQTKDMLNLLVEKGYCNITTELLRPLVAIPLKHNDIEGAVNTFIACVDKYKKTPLALEILTVLLQHKDNSKLPNAEMYIKRIYNILITLYSKENANTLLVLALATLDKTQELQTILQTQQISTNNLMNYFNYARRNNYVDSLLKLFKAIPDSSNFNQLILSEMLLSIYNKMGDYENAIKLWKLMCVKNLKPSEKFKNTFIQFLQANKVPLPSEFEQERNETTNVSDQKI